MFWICKMCGRSVRQEKKPKCCYADCMDSIENISDEDAGKMGLFIPEGERFEFPGDVRWDPDTGKRIEAPLDYAQGQFYTQREFQESIMERVRA